MSGVIAVEHAHSCRSNADSDLRAVSVAALLGWLRHRLEVTSTACVELSIEAALDDGDFPQGAQASVSILSLLKHFVARLPRAALVIHKL